MIYRYESCSPGVTAQQVGAHLREIGQLSEQGAKTTSHDGLCAVTPIPGRQNSLMGRDLVLMDSGKLPDSKISELRAGRKQPDLKDIHGIASALAEIRFSDSIDPWRDASPSELLLLSNNLDWDLPVELVSPSSQPVPLGQAHQIPWGDTG